MPRPVLVLQHQSDVTVDALGGHLVRLGAALDVVDATTSPVPDLAGYGAMVVLGGEMNVWQEAEHPWLAGEKAAIREWVRAGDRPLLGICLGHQLLADALGGEVGRRDVAEAGTHTVTLTAAGVGDALLGPLGPTPATMQWHGAEVHRPPDGAVVLAANDACAVQAMRIGAWAWGVQFHPEVAVATAEEWGRHPTFRALLEQGGGPDAAERYPAALAAAATDLEHVTATLARSLLARVGDAARLVR